MHDLAEIVAWYEGKTESILDKYGGNPRIHFHTGYVPPCATFGRTLDELRRQLHHAQEEMLWVGAAVWGAEGARGGRILDVGAGLGGGSLFWAAEYEAHVTALTPVPRHVDIIREQAREARLQSQIEAVVGHASEMRHLGRFDAIVSVGASTYFDRAAWFDEMAEMLPSGGRVFLEDTFLVDPSVAGPFNDYWVADIGTPAEYHGAAEQAGFRCIRAVDVSEAARDFYRLSIGYAECELRAADSSESRRRHLQRSIPYQRWFAEMNGTRAFLDLLLCYEKV